MKRYIQPQSTPVALHAEGFLAASGGLPIGAEKGDETDYANRKRGGWSSEQWAAPAEEE